MSTREDVIKKKLALQDSIRAEMSPRKKAILQKRFDALRIPTHGETQAVKSKTFMERLGIKKGGTAVEAMKKRQATLDSLRNAKEED